VAAHERRVNRTVSKLLKGYLWRSALLYFVLGTAQYLLTGEYWLRWPGRMPIAGMALGAWGAIAAFNVNSLVWRSLPIAAKDASVFRWWSMAGAPGIFLTLVTGVAWISNRSSGFPTPAPDVILEGIFANWAVLGIVAGLFRSPAFYYAVPARGTKTLATVTCAILLLCYGVPVGLAARPYSIVFIGGGIIVLLVSAVRAHRGLDWHWPDLKRPDAKSARNPATLLRTARYGLSAILIPLAQRTAIFAIAATVIIVSLQRVFPAATTALVWIYFTGVSSAGFLLTFQVRQAIQPLRCLPLSAKQLAGLLLLFGALPGLATLGLTLLVNRAVLNAGLDVVEVTTFAFVIIATQALPMRIPREQNVFFKYWQPLVQRIFGPAYVGFFGAYASMPGGRALWMRWPAVHWSLQAGGVGLCIAGYFILVQQLRSGVRPSSNENAFSQG
jgi:hypothetical protein